MGEWKEYKLGEIADIIPGFAFKSKDFGLVGEYVVKIKDIIPPCINIMSADKVDISEYNASRLEKYILHEGDYVVAMTGATIGKVGKLKVKVKAFLNQRVAKIKAKDGICDNFIYYMLCTDDFQGFIQNNIDSNSAQENISANSIARFPVLLPSISEQKHIASILTSLDDKIDLLHRENATLEAMAETFFRQLFIEDAKDSWEEGNISDLIEFNPTRKLVKGKVASYLEMSNLSTSTYAPTYWYDRAFTSGSKFENGDTLLARITPCLENGKTAYVDFCNDGEIGWGSTEFIVMRSKFGLHPFFSYIVAKYRDFREYAKLCMSGSSGRQRVDVENLKNYPIYIPSEDVIDKLNSILESIVLKMQVNNMQIRSLVSERDILLPKLMSNEINI